MNESPERLACSLSEPELRERASEIRRGFARRITTTRELEDGVALRIALSDEAIEEAEAFVAFERRCCEFATFTLRRDDASDALWIEIRGPEGTKAFFQDLIARR